MEDYHEGGALSPSCERLTNERIILVWNFGIERWSGAVVLRMVNVDLWFRVGWGSFPFDDESDLSFIFQITWFSLSLCVYVSLFSFLVYQACDNVVIQSG